MSSHFTLLISKHFEDITDPRVNRGHNYCLIELIFLAVCATISRAEGWADIERWGNSKLKWLRQYLPYEKGIPSHDTLGRVFARFDTTEFNAALIGLTGDIASLVAGKTIAIDGKSLRGSHDAATSKSVLHVVTAYATEMKLVIGMRSVEDKSNEIPAAQQLIDMLHLKGAVVTADAMHCQRQTVEKIIAKKADYLLMAKENQPALFQEVDRLVLAAMENNQSRRTSQRERNRGREEHREVEIVAVPADHPLREQWKGLQSVGVIYRMRKIGQQIQEETEIFISSLTTGVKDHAKRIREHWSIENSQHYILDVTFQEDASRIRKANGPEITAGIRRMALNILQRDKTIRDNIRGKRVRCSYDDALLSQLLQHFQ